MTEKNRFRSKEGAVKVWWIHPNYGPLAYCLHSTSALGTWLNKKRMPDMQHHEITLFRRHKNPCAFIDSTSLRVPRFARPCFLSWLSDRTTWTTWDLWCRTWALTLRTGKRRSRRWKRGGDSAACLACLGNRHLQLREWVNKKLAYGTGAPYLLLRSICFLFETNFLFLCVLYLVHNRCCCKTVRRNCRCEWAVTFHIILSVPWN